MDSLNKPEKHSKPQHAPITPLDNNIARVYTHIHPVLVLSIFLVSFRLIVQDPVSSLASLLVPLAALQAIYVVLCLPPTGSHPGLAGQAAKKSTGGSGKKGAKKNADLPLGMKVIPSLISILLTLTLGTPLFLLLTILFGAPFTTHLPHTILLSAHISLLSAVPIIYTRGIDKQTWRAVASLLLPIDETFGAALGTVLGAWFGAVPIPLDWDREWQRWPVTVVSGAYVGWVVGKVMGRYVFRGRVVDMRA